MLTWNFNTLATSCEELTHLKRPWCWERLKAGGERDNGEHDGWMASLTRWMQLWVNSGSWWWTGRPGVLQFMESQSRTRLSDWTELMILYMFQCHSPKSSHPRPLPQSSKDCSIHLQLLDLSTAQLGLKLMSFSCVWTDLNGKQKNVFQLLV